MPRIREQVPFVSAAPVCVAVAGCFGPCSCASILCSRPVQVVRVSVLECAVGMVAFRCLRQSCLRPPSVQMWQRPPWRFMCGPPVRRRWRLLPLVIAQLHSAVSTSQILTWVSSSVFYCALSCVSCICSSNELQHSEHQADSISVHRLQQLLIDRYNTDYFWPQVGIELSEGLV